MVEASAAGAAKGGAVGTLAAGAVDVATGNGFDQLRAGLDIASQAAGDVLRGIFGGLPWEMSPSEIVEAVTGGAGGAEQVPATVVPYLMDLVGVVG